MSHPHRCSRCNKNAEMRRVNRQGWLQRALLSRLGVFPWECVICRRKQFLRDRGNEARRAA